MHKVFQVHKLNEAGLALITEIAEKFDLLLAEVSHYAGESRELSITTTKLEEACFYAKKAIASNSSLQQ